MTKAARERALDSAIASGDLAWLLGADGSGRLEGYRSDFLAGGSSFLRPPTERAS